MEALPSHTIFSLCSTAKSFADVCSSVDEPDDVTLGIVTGLSKSCVDMVTPLMHTHVHIKHAHTTPTHAHTPTHVHTCTHTYTCTHMHTGAVLRYPMVRTNLIHTHGQNLAASVHPLMLHKQVRAMWGRGRGLVTSAYY